MKTQHYSCSLQTVHKILKIEWWDAFPIIYRAYHIWQCSSLVIHFPALAIGQHKLSRPCHWSTYIIPALSLLHTFQPSALGIGCYIFPSFFPVHVIGYTFSRHLPLTNIHFPALVTGYTFPHPPACHLLPLPYWLLSCRLHVLHTQATWFDFRRSLGPDLLSAGSTLV